MSIPWRGRHRARVFNKNKPVSYALKGYCLNEATTGYCLSCFMYQGRDEKRPKGVTATSWPVVKLVGEDKALHNKGYILWTDNWFTGLPTLRVCLDAGVDFGGTARADRLGTSWTKKTGTPADKASKAADKKATGAWTRGQYRAKKTTVNGKDVWAVQWQDNKLVSFLTTIQSVVGNTNRKAVDKKTRLYTNLPIQIVSIFSAYNFGKVGTDRMDQMVMCYYRNTRLRWHVKVMYHVMLMALSNAHISHLTITKQTKQECTYLQFMQSVLTEFRQAGKHTRTAHIGSTHTPCKKGKTPHNEPGGKKFEVGKHKHGKRTRCIVCKTYIETWCIECKQHMHIVTQNSGKQCWSLFHRNPEKYL